MICIVYIKDEKEIPDKLNEKERIIIYLMKLHTEYIELGKNTLVCPEGSRLAGVYKSLADMLETKAFAVRNYGVRGR